MSLLQTSVILSSLLLMVSCQQSTVGHLRGEHEQNLQQIVGGSSALEGEFPFAVNIWFDSPSDNYVAHLCGASLIDAKWVLTAAHCVLEDESESSMRVVKPNKLKLYMGSNQHSGEGARQLKVKSIRVHPDFSWPHHDIALIELAELVTDISPVALSSEDLGSSNDLVTVVGWGLVDKNGNEGSTLQKLMVSLVPRDICAQDEFPQSREISVGRDMLCIQTNLHQTSSCPGDSGGPLLRLVNGKYQQIGVVSWGSACSPSRAPSKSSVAGYADVSDALAWIRSQMKLNSK